MTDEHVAISTEADQSGQDYAVDAEIDAVVKRLRAKVEERRRDGMYPPGFEEQLDEHFRRIVFHRVDGDPTRLVQTEASLRSSSYFDLDRISTESGAIGGERLHRSVAKLIRRQTQGMMDQFQDFANEVRDWSEATTAAVQDGSLHVHPDLARQIDSIIERLDSYERGPRDAGSAIGDLRRRIELLEQDRATRVVKAPFDDESFARAFGGAPSLNELKAMRAVVGDLSGRTLLFGNLASGVGVSTEAATLADLRDADDKSLAGVIVMNELERMTAQQQLDFFSHAAEKLRTGGRFFLRAVDPGTAVQHPAVQHVVPVEYVRFVLQQSGFTEISSPAPTDQNFVVTAVR